MTKPAFRTSEKSGYYVVEVFYMSRATLPLFDDFETEEYFEEAEYQRMADWCYNQLKTWLKPRRARRMSYSEFWFKSKKDADWFILYWSAIDI